MDCKSPFNVGDGGSCTGHRSWGHGHDDSPLVEDRFSIVALGYPKPKTNISSGKQTVCYFSNGHRNSWFMSIYSLNMVDLSSSFFLNVYHYQRVNWRLPLAKFYPSGGSPQSPQSILGYETYRGSTETKITSDFFHDLDISFLFFFKYGGAKKTITMISKWSCPCRKGIIGVSFHGWLSGGHSPREKDHQSKPENLDHQARAYPRFLGPLILKNPVDNIPLMRHKTSPR